MNDINFLKNVNIRNRTNYNKNLKVFIIAVVSFSSILLGINIWQIYKLYVAKKVFIISKKDVENLDSVIQDNNHIKTQLKQLQQQIMISSDLIKTNNKVLDLVISIANIMPEDSYLKAFSFKPIIKLGLDLPNISNTENGNNIPDKEYGLGKIKLQGYTTSKSITDFLERLSRLEIVDNVKLIYLKYPENHDSNLLEFSIKLLLNNI